ncbi:hypothetical protein CO110_04105 [Candidatus Desantisbacteria bacterium CG_4_9_14_3_um_filter_40_11]|uniref:Uncharacterized protein n=1 Tax=Candidatus Desantisbacteria bacterium CG_4_9_14_3_um_filter_40_11 TaxID=1974546 RepID=A0A2M8AUG9_9BACT|nr:MAG: hypothetical protein CO110_04105 [Candidatus Desantisbacteria bacterium CG_4_9_14_3_um_filter_40_11]
MPEQPSYPVGASAICNDGTYSYSSHRRGTSRLYFSLIA